MSRSVGIIITTVEKRKESLLWSIRHLTRFIEVPFTIYIYNDAGSPLKEHLERAIKESGREDAAFEVFNDNKEINTGKIGCGGGRHYLFEIAKTKSDIVISLDDDIQITEGWFRAINNAIDEYKEISVFTGILKGPRGEVQVAGSSMSITDGKLIRKENRTVRGRHTVADWGPLGYLVLCRKALQPYVVIPELYVREDSAFFLELRKLGISETVVVSGAVAIHRPKPVPGSDLRLPQKMNEAREYYKIHYGIEIE